MAIKATEKSVRVVIKLEDSSITINKIVPDVTDANLYNCSMSIGSLSSDDIENINRIETEVLIEEE